MILNNQYIKDKINFHVSYPSKYEVQAFVFLFGFDTDFIQINM